MLLASGQQPYSNYCVSLTRVRPVTILAISPPNEAVTTPIYHTPYGMVPEGEFIVERYPQVFGLSLIHI